MRNFTVALETTPCNDRARSPTTSSLAHENSRHRGYRCLLRAMGFRPWGSRGVGGSEIAGYFLLEVMIHPSKCMLNITKSLKAKGMPDGHQVLLSAFLASCSHKGQIDRIPTALLRHNCKYCRTKCVIMSKISWIFICSSRDGKQRSPLNGDATRG